MTPRTTNNPGKEPVGPNQHRNQNHRGNKQQEAGQQQTNTSNQRDTNTKEGQQQQQQRGQAKRLTQEAPPSPPKVSGALCGVAGHDTNEKQKHRATGEREGGPSTRSDKLYHTSQSDHIHIKQKQKQGLREKRVPSTAPLALGTLVYTVPNLARSVSLELLSQADADAAEAARLELNECEMTSHQLAVRMRPPI